MHNWISANRKRLARFALGAALSLAAAPAIGAEYHGIVVGDDYIMLLDKSSIYQTNGYSRGWLVTIYETPQDEGDHPYVFASMLLEVDCGQNRSRPISYTSRDEKGDVVDSQDISDGDWTHFEPSTNGEHIRDGICSPETLTDSPMPSDDLLRLRDAYLATLADQKK